MKHWALFALIAAAGTVLLAALAPVAHPAAQWKIYSNGEMSQARSRETSAALGVETEGWTGAVTGGSDGHAPFAGSPRFTPIYAKVVLRDPVGSGHILTTVSASGDINSWEWKSYPSTPPPHPADPRVLASTALARITGADAASFHPLPESSPESGTRLFAYEKTAPVTLRFEATVSGGRLVKAELNPQYTREIDRAVSAQKKYRSWFEGAAAVGIVFLGSVLACGVYVFWAVRRAVRHRFVLAFAATALVWGAIYWSNWMVYDERYDTLSGSSSLAEGLFGGGLVEVCLVLLLIGLTGAADAIGVQPKLASLRNMFRAPALTRDSGASILCGFLCAPLLAALPLAVSQFHFFGSQRTGDYAPSLIFSAHPALQALDVNVPLTLLGIFGFGTGFLVRYIRKPWLAWLLLFVPAVLILSTDSLPSETSPAGFLLSGAIAAAAYYQLFLRVDLLAVLAAGWGARVLFNSAALALQPAASLHSSGTIAYVSLAALTGFAALVAWHGREPEPDLADAPGIVTSQRDALMKEFSIAHRVQQQMLPGRPPDIPSCTVSASCQPAQEVGGDLFDFLQLPDGRWSIGVGDVSGKGVHAALYMTLTKGLLTATTQDSSDLVEIVGNVNGHVHAATEKKTFVTLAMGAFDPETRSFDHVRAGHNPIVWRSPVRGETSLLSAPGLGLGIVPDRLFRRSLRQETLQLNAGDALVFYSDGVTEAMNSSSEQFGEERLMRSVESADGLEAGLVREQILADVKQFLNGVAPQDDMTIVVLRVN